MDRSKISGEYFPCMLNQVKRPMKYACSKPGWEKIKLYWKTSQYIGILCPASNEHGESPISISGVPSSHMYPASNEHLASSTSIFGVLIAICAPLPMSTCQVPLPYHPPTPTSREHRNSPTSKELLLCYSPSETGTPDN